MISKSQILSVRSLHEKSARHTSRYFLVEGAKGIEECLKSDMEISEGFFTQKYIDTGVRIPCEYTVVSSSELARMTTLVSNDCGILVVRMRGKTQYIRPNGNTDIVLVLDGISDPGNLGTILRTADWYGISHIVVSVDTVDLYNPKVIISTMGSYTRVHTHYTDLAKYLEQVHTSGEPIYGAYMHGESTYTQDWTRGACHIVIGSESHGISAELATYISHPVTIPRVGMAESLNAGIATGILLDTMTRGRI